MNKSSLPYWIDRWGAHPAEFSTSWPDAGCRILELQYVKTWLKSLPADQMIVELGCGNFQLAEDPEIPELLKGRYIGVDGCAIALQAAVDRKLPGLRFIQADLAVDHHSYVDPKAEVLTKRTIQNIAPEERTMLWRSIAKFRGGLLIEDFKPFRTHMDAVRHGMKRDPLAVPEFNWPIDLNEEIHKLPGLYFYTFMGYYYEVTRGQPDVPDDIRVMALRLSQWALQEGRCQPANGPVAACHWGKP